MSDDDSIFDDLGVPEIRVSERDIKDEMAESAWRLWMSLTERPKAKIPYRFKSLYVELLDQQYSNERLMRCVSGAAYLPIQKRDPQDIGRLINALRYNGTEAQAISLLDSGKAEIVKWEWQDEIIPLSSVHDVEEICGIPMGLWAPDQHDYAGILIGQLDRERLEEVADLVRIHIGEDELFPSEVIRHHRIWSGKGDKKLSAKIRSSRDTYHSGSKESELIGHVDTEADPASGRLILNGCPPKKVATFHDQAPAGYWSAVMDILEDNLDMALSAIYQELEGDFDGWSPDKRVKPEW